MDLAAALNHAETSLTLARQLGARRFEAEGLALCSEIHRRTGKRATALAEAREAVTISRETGPSFLGPFMLGILALVTDDPVQSRAALDEADELLRSGAVSHNHLLLRRDAIDACLAMEDWDGAERFAAALEDYTLSEPLPFSTFYVARARALAACGRDQADVGILDELERLRDEGERFGLRMALPEIGLAIARYRSG